MFLCLDTNISCFKRKYFLGEEKFVGLKIIFLGLKENISWLKKGIYFGWKVINCKMAVATVEAAKICWCSKHKHVLVWKKIFLGWKETCSWFKQWYFLVDKVYIFWLKIFMFLGWNKSNITASWFGRLRN